MDAGINYEGYEQVIMLCYTIHTITQFIPTLERKKMMILAYWSKCKANAQD